MPPQRTASLKRVSSTFNNMKPTADIIDKIRKCLNLANGLNATPGEMEAAMAKAKELAMRHSIELASINMEQGKSVSDGDTISKDSTLRTRSKYQQPYHRWMIGALQEVFGVTIIKSIFHETNGVRITAIHVIGDATDVEITKVMFPYLEKIFPRILSAAVSKGSLRYSAADTNGCYRGLYEGIVTANKREVEKLNQTDKSLWGMVVFDRSKAIEKVVKEAFPGVMHHRSRAQKANMTAFAYGRAEGEKINLRQVSQAPQPKVKINSLLK